jgi:hypothetical protein
VGPKALASTTMVLYYCAGLHFFRRLLVNEVALASVMKPGGKKDLLREVEVEVWDAFSGCAFGYGTSWKKIAVREQIVAMNNERANIC